MLDQACLTRQDRILLPPQRLDTWQTNHLLVEACHLEQDLVGEEWDRREHLDAVDEVCPLLVDAVAVDHLHQAPVEEDQCLDVVVRLSLVGRVDVVWLLEAVVLEDEEGPEE